MSYRRYQYSLLAGTLIFLLVVLILLTSSNTLFSPVVTFIDTELNRSSGDEVSVRTKADFGSYEHMSAFVCSQRNWDNSGI
jgi:hypothetical protein